MLVRLVGLLTWSWSAHAGTLDLDFEDLACTGPGIESVGSIVAAGWEIRPRSFGTFRPATWAPCDAHPDHGSSTSLAGFGITLERVRETEVHANQVWFTSAPAACERGLMLDPSGNDLCDEGHGVAVSMAIWFYDDDGVRFLTRTAGLGASIVAGSPGVRRIDIVPVDTTGGPGFASIDNLFVLDDAQPRFEIMASKLDCPTRGPSVLTWRDATPSGPVRLLLARSLGVLGEVPTGPCTGTPIRLDPATTLAPSWGVAASNPSGKGFTTKALPAVACGAYVQAVDETTCEVSNPEALD